MPYHIDASLHCDEQGNRCHNDNLKQMACDNLNITNPLLEFLKNDFLLQDDEELRSLLQKEKEKEPYSEFQVEPSHSLAEERRETVDWMLSVVGCYSFSAVTAILAVNYFDRFLYSFHKVNVMKPWMSQLAAVACLSLAAKVEETHVPLLIDLQVEECKYVFEPKTIQRMEILILTTLQWKMHPATAHSFLEYVSRRLDSKNSLKREFLKRSECLLLSIVSDCRFTNYLPSTLANSIMLYVINSLEPCIGVYHQDQLMGIFGISKEKVKECCGLIQEVVSSVDYVTNKKRKFGSVMPQSPKGVVGVCFSTDSSDDEPWELLSSTASVSSSPEPILKKMKP